MLIGTALIALVQFDILATILHPEVESPLSTRFQQLTWRILKLIACAIGQGDATTRVLNWGLPLMVAGLIGLWAILLTIGFALLYYPWIGSSTFFIAPTTSRSSAIDALYYSGSTLTTLGAADIQPVTWPFRLLAVLESATGAITTAFGVAYVLMVYPALSRLRALAVVLDAEVAGHASAVPMVRRYLVESQAWSPDLVHRLRGLAVELLAIAEVHETQPVIYYAHPRRVQHSFVRVLVLTQSLVGLLRYGLSPDRHRELVQNPQLLLLEQTLHYSLRRLNTSLHVRAVDRADDPAARARLAADYQTLCVTIDQLGLTSARTMATQPVPVLVETEMPQEEAPLPDIRREGNERPPAQPPAASEASDPALDQVSDSAVEAYRIFREATDEYINAYAAASGYSITAVRADYATTWWKSGR
jgi:hypothetical protein